MLIFYALYCLDEDFYINSRAIIFNSCLQFNSAMKERAEGFGKSGRGKNITKSNYRKLSHDINFLSFILTLTDALPKNLTINSYPSHKLTHS